MDVKLAASDMRDLIRDSSLPEINSEYGKDHLYGMVYKLRTGKITSREAHLWLGYIQGCVVSHGGATLEEVKLVNFKTKGEKVCDHGGENNIPYYAHVECGNCGNVLVDSQWGQASRMWFKNIIEARYYEENGKLPEE